ncbi:type 4a pilus biogenesis protein PilO [Pseudomonas capeferrum]|uniref:pilus assembly protein PilP n=1 Tax=Pseudomonas capeferrum TaxID=1495066 RepID=UPI0015E32E12|nr:pilus assembly protein PilP [Pseudomonas capeferrum]MBA1202359.1 type 4a pilus biogenesis protein PilO [Pseudomonas capeferrum]
MSTFRVPNWHAIAGSPLALKIGLWVLIVLGVVALGQGVLLEGRRQEYRREVALSHELQAEEQARKLQVRQFQPVLEALALAEVELRDARWRLAAGGGMSEVLEQLAVSGREHGLLFERVEVLDGTAENDHRRIPLDVQVVGRYPALRQWLDEWLGQLRLLQVQTLHLAAVDEVAHLLRLKLRIQTFDAGADLSVPASLAEEPARLAAAVPVRDPFAHWSSRSVASGLAGLPLEQLEMVGSLGGTRGHQALVRFAGRVHRVRLGDPLGRNEGVVVRIDEHQVEVHERVFVSDGWQERSSYLVLVKPIEVEVEDERRTNRRSAAGDVVDVAIGDGVAAQ